MARSRNIKPGLFKNEILGEADPLLTILFQGLWCLADREGRMEDRPKRIKAEIFPYREIPDFNGYLTVLQQLGFIIRYSVENQPIIQIINFKKHQSPHKTEKPSELPEYCLDSDTCKVTVKAPLNNGSVTDEAALIPDPFNLIPDPLNKQPPPLYATPISSNRHWQMSRELCSWLVTKSTVKPSSSTTNRMGGPSMAG